MPITIAVQIAIKSRSIPMDPFCSIVLQLPTLKIGIVDLISVLSSCACAWWLQLFVRMCVKTSTLLWLRAHVRDDSPVGPILGTSGDHLGPLGTIWGPSGDHLGQKYIKIDQHIVSYINHQNIFENPLFRNGSKTNFSEMGLAQLDIYERYT